jgi:uncharacterized membrane protein YsdA (DUF1294 family)
MTLFLISVVFGVFGVWSAVNPSFFTIRKFAETPEDKRLIAQGVILAAVIIAVTIIVNWLIFRRKAE